MVGAYCACLFVELPAICLSTQSIDLCKQEQRCDGYQRREALLKHHEAYVQLPEFTIRLFPIPDDFILRL